MQQYYCQQPPFIFTFSISFWQVRASSASSPAFCSLMIQTTHKSISEAFFQRLSKFIMCGELPQGSIKFSNAFICSLGAPMKNGIYLLSLSVFTGSEQKALPKVEQTNVDQENQVQPDLLIEKGIPAPNELKRMGTCLSSAISFSLQKRCELQASQNRVNFRVKLFRTFVLPCHTGNAIPFNGMGFWRSQPCCHNVVS